MTRVMIFYASIGSGHYAAARAVQLALAEQSSGVEVRVEDVFSRTQQRSGLGDLLSGFSLRLFPRLYDWSWRTGAMMWAFNLTRKLPIFRRRVLQLARAFHPDVTVCTHALPCAILAAEIGRQPMPPLLGVATDYQVHPYWPVRVVQGFVVAGESSQRDLIKRGAAPSRVFVDGIPVQASREARTTPGKDGLHVLVLAGARQVGPYLPLAPRLRELIGLLSRQPLDGVQWTWVFGKHDRMFAYAREKLSGRADISLHGYVEDMPRRLAAADLVLTKPGGSILAESLAAGKPVLLLHKGAGQERANYDTLLAAGAAVAPESAAEVFDCLKQLRDSPEQYAPLQQAASRLGVPDSAERVAKRVLELAGGSLIG